MALARLAIGWLVACACIIAPRDARADSATSTVTLAVSTFRNTNGVLGCQLYDSGVGFPDRWPSNPSFNQRVRVTGATTECVFTVAPGTYAAAVLHDENANNKMDTNLIGVPVEGYGVSNNHTHALRRPTWDESKFVVERGAHVRLAVALRY